MAMSVVWPVNPAIRTACYADCTVYSAAGGTDRREVWRDVRISCSTPVLQVCDRRPVRAACRLTRQVFASHIVVRRAARRFDGVGHTTPRATVRNQRFTTEFVRA